MLRGITGLAIAICGSMLLTSFDVSATRYYKSIDENGKVVFSDRPANTAAEQINIQVFTPDLPALPAPTTKKSREDTTSEGEKKEAKEDLKALQTTRNENCKKAKNRLQQLQTISRLYSEDEKGNRTYVTDEDRVKQLTGARTLIKEWCK